MPKVREANYDLLRICSAFAVVMLHVSSGFLLYDVVSVPTNCNLPVMLINNTVRFAVPCFFMLSGAFILADERNADYRYFYRKSIKNIGITGAIFCVLYVIYRVLKLVLSIYVLHNHSESTLLSGLCLIGVDTLTGHPFNHLWYLFALVGVYIAAPFVIRLAAELRRGGKSIR